MFHVSGFYNRNSLCLSEKVSLSPNLAVNSQVFGVAASLWIPVPSVWVRVGVNEAGEPVQKHGQAVDSNAF